MTDRIPDSSTENCTAALAHLAFCALVALAFARQDGVACTPAAGNLFLVRWLATAQKQKRFPKSVAVDIAWLLERGRKHGPAGRLVQHLEYLWRSCSGDLKAQSGLFRLTYVTETLKDSGWENWVLNATEWKQHPDDLRIRGNGFLVEKLSLHRSFDTAGRQTAPVAFRIIGDTGTFLQTLTKFGFTVRTTGKTTSYDTMTLYPDF